MNTTAGVTGKNNTDFQNDTRQLDKKEIPYRTFSETGVIVLLRRETNLNRRVTDEQFQKWIEETW